MPGSPVVPGVSGIPVDSGVENLVVPGVSGMSTFGVGMSTFGAEMSISIATSISAVAAAIRRRGVVDDDDDDFGEALS